MTRVGAAAQGACLVLLLVAVSAAAAPRHVYLTWQSDPSTAITVNVHTLGTAAAAQEPLFAVVGADLAYTAIGAATWGQVKRDVAERR